MATDIAVNRGNRSMLATTLKTLQQLKKLKREHHEQQAEIRKHIISLELQLKEAKKQQADLKASLAAISQSIVQMELVERNLQYAMSPMRHLPEDILLHLFRIIVQGVNSTRNNLAETWAYKSNSNRCILLRLSGVCKRWRTTIERNSSLLTTVEVRMPKSDKDLERERQLVTHWMKAGKTRDLTLFVDEWALADPQIGDMLFGSGTTEWKAIRISIEDEPDGSWDIGDVSTHELTVYRNQTMDLHHIIPLIRQAEVVVLYGRTNQWGSLPWIHLRSLTIKNFAYAIGDMREPLPFGASEFTALLLAATELIELTLDFVAEEATPVEDAPVSISHAKLSHLSLHLHHFVVGKGPFGVQFTAPSLQKLELISLPCSSYTEYTENAPFVCIGQLRVISLPNMSDKGVFFAAELSKWLPDVYTLEVRGANVDTLFVLFHTLLHHVPPLTLPFPLPKLNSLFITDSDLRGETLIELLESRLRHVHSNTPGVCAITEVKMYNSPAVTPSQWARVQELLGEGINSTRVITGDGIEG